MKTFSFPSKILKKILLAFLIIFILIQFIRPARNTRTLLSANDVTLSLNVPDTVLAVLKSSCYDCHSNNTVYPWYSNVQPVAWWLNSHITKGKKELNFNEFGSYTLKRKLNKLKAIVHEIKDDDMPLSSYTLIHKYAKLTDGQKALITSWATQSADSLTLRNK